LLKILKLFRNFSQETVTVALSSAIFKANLHPLTLTESMHRTVAQTRWN